MPPAVAVHDKNKEHQEKQRITRKTKSNKKTKEQQENQRTTRKTKNNNKKNKEQQHAEKEFVVWGRNKRLIALCFTGEPEMKQKGKMRTK